MFDGRPGSMRPDLAMLTQAALEFCISLVSASASHVLGILSFSVVDNVLTAGERKELSVG